MKLGMTIVFAGVLVLCFQNCQQKVSLSASEVSLNSVATGNLKSCRDTNEIKDKWTYYLFVYGYSQHQCEGAPDLFLADNSYCAKGKLYDTFEQCEEQRLKEISNSCDAPNNKEIYPWGEGRMDPSVNIVPMSLCYQFKD